MNFPDTFNELKQWYDALRHTMSGPDLIQAMQSRIGSETHTDRLNVLNLFLAREHISQGNRAAAEAIRRQNPRAEVHRWHDQWRVANPNSDIVPLLERKIREEPDPAKLETLRYLL